jgi:hypothetical protein
MIKNSFEVFHLTDDLKGCHVYGQHHDTQYNDAQHEDTHNKEIQHNDAA